MGKAQKKRKSTRIVCLGPRCGPGECKKTARSYCPDCGDYRRCKEHCLCKGTKNAQGQKAPRSRENSAASSGASPAAAETGNAVAVMAPAVGRPAPLSCDVFTDSSWIDKCVSEIQKSKRILLASYVFNNTIVHNKLISRLQDRTSFEAVIAVDQAAYHGNICPGEKTRLSELKAAGATIHLVPGIRGNGIFHWKCLVLDSRIVYTGSANYTNGCLHSWEMVLRLMGPPLIPIRDGLSNAIQVGTRLQLVFASTGIFIFSSRRRAVIK